MGSRLAHHGHEGGCSNVECICHVPMWEVCDEWMGERWDEWCPRCGWNRASHPTLGAAVLTGSTDAGASAEVGE